jgi:O-antigen ligase
VIRAELTSAGGHPLWRTLAFGGVGLAALYMGWAIAARGTQATLVFGIVAVVALSLRPMIGMYACYVLLLIVPYTDQQFEVPVLQSPLQTIAAISVIGALLRYASSRRPMPQSHVYLPLGLVIGIYILFVAIQHGDVPGVRAYDLLAGLWPLPLILMLVDTPRRARNVLLCILSVAVLLTVIWLPGLIAVSTEGDYVRSIVNTGSFDDPGTSLLGTVGSLSVQTLVALALVAPVLLGIGLSTHRWRVTSFLSFVILGTVIFAATYASAVATLVVGTLATAGLYLLRQGNLRVPRLRGALLAVAIVGIVAGIGLTLKPGQESLRRLTDPVADVSGRGRITSLEQGWHAFLEEPLIGHGAYNAYHITPEGWILGGHNTFGVMAYEYGLVGILPFLWLLWTMAKELLRLFRGAKIPVERGIAAGFVGSFIAAIVTGFLTPTFAQVFQDTILWTFVGLAIVWNNWRSADTEASLVR